MSEENANFVKIDEELGLVFGWAIVCTINGVQYFDLNRNPLTGDLEPDGITQKGMLRAGMYYMEGDRVAKIMHRGGIVGKIIFAWPETDETLQAFDMTSKITGLKVCFKPDNKADIEKFKDGTFTGFSIGGEYGELEVIYE